MEVVSMSYDYTINDIAEKTNVSLQSCYGLIKKNREFIDNNSVRRHRKIYYNQEVMNFFIDYYQPVEERPPKAENPIVEERPPEGQSPSANIPVLSPDKPVESERQPETDTDVLQRKIDVLQAEIDALKKELASKEEERKELIHQNGALILTLQQEKQEKQLFLPSPKKSFAERIKSLFK